MTSHRFPLVFVLLAAVIGSGRAARPLTSGLALEFILDSSNGDVAALNGRVGYCEA
jgi:hypothetical protein